MTVHPAVRKLGVNGLFVLAALVCFLAAFAVSMGWMNGNFNALLAAGFVVLTAGSLVG